MHPSDHQPSLLAADPSFWRGIRTANLTGSDQAVAEVTGRLPKELAVQKAKAGKPFLWIVFLGGTGTGKSTVFNLLCGQNVSRVGLERPMTSGPVLFAHSSLDLAPFLPFFLPRLQEVDGSSGVRGAADTLSRVDHDRGELAHLVLVDTPDLDSLVAENLRLAEDLCLLADAVVFVTSQEKYADDVLVRFLRDVARSDRPLFLVFNKLEVEAQERQSLINQLSQEAESDSVRPEHIWSLPFSPGSPGQTLQGHPVFTSFSENLSRELSADKVAALLDKQRALQWRRTRSDIEGLRGLLLAEEQAADRWLDELDELKAAAGRRLIQRAEKRFQDTGRRHIQAEIRKLYSRYDLLAGPRRAIAKTILLPFRLLRPAQAPKQGSRLQLLEQVRRQTEMEPALQALDELQQSVLKQLSPPEATGDLHSCLRRSEVLVGRSEARQRIEAEQDRLADWLQERFQALTAQVPKRKVYGIYTTSILWGVLLIAFESVVGGGLTLIDALVDSALAPFLTAGTVELFVYREVQSIARELAERYRNGLLALLDLQRQRFAACLEERRTSQEVLDTLLALSRQPAPS